MPETPATFARWREIAVRHRVVGTKVHDANLVAVADVYGAVAILTLNPDDFMRYGTVKVLTPRQVLASRPSN